MGKKKKNRVLTIAANTCGYIVCVPALLFAAAVFLISLFQTCYVNLEEHISFGSDSFITNLVALGVVLALFVMLRRVKRKKWMALTAAGLALFITLVVSVVWVVSVKSIPAADSGKVTTAAIDAANGSYTLLQKGGYFTVFPFQLGCVLFYEAIFRVFGTANYILLLGIINALFLTAAYGAILRLTHLVYRDWRVFLFTALLLVLCIQPMLFTTFLYGTIPGLAFALWSAVFAVRYMQENNKLLLLPMVLLIAVACLIKQNYLIFLTAIGLLLIVHTIRTRRAFCLVGVASMLLVTVLLSFGTKKLYEQRAKVSFGSGTPAAAWFAAGLQESPRAPGWYNGYTTKLLQSYEFNTDAAMDDVAAKIAERREVFLRRPRYFISFFYHKFASQWNETTYESVWISKVKQHDGVLPAFVGKVYDGDGTGLATPVEKYCNQYMQAVFCLFFIGMVFVFLRDPKKEALLLLPLIVLGGAMYHLLFEAKSQYVISYLPLLLPTAAFGAERLGRALLGNEKEKPAAGKKPAVPQKKKPKPGAIK